MVTAILIGMALLIPVAIGVGVFLGNRLPLNADSQYMIDRRGK